MSLESDIRILRQVPFFASFGDDHLRLLAFGGENRRFRAGQHLFRTGDNSDGGLVILSGEVRVPEDRGAGEGQLFGPATLFGQRSLLARNQRHHSAVAQGEVDAILIRRTLFVRMLSEFPDLADRLYREMSADLRALTDQAALLVRQQGG